MNLAQQFLVELRDLGDGGGWIFWAIIALAFGIAFALLSLWNALHFPGATVLSSREWRQLLLRPARSTEIFHRLSANLSSSNDPGSRLHEMSQHLFAVPERRFPFAFVMIGAAPLLGLLGTVSGMFTTFGGMATTSANSPIDVISDGIAEALITTETGLVVAIPTLIVCTLLKSRFDGLVIRFQRLQSQLLQRSATSDT